MKKLIISLLLIILLAGGAVFTGLANPLVEMQVKSALVESGIGEKRAACMAERMVDRLTIPQLWKLRQGMAAQEGEPEEGYGLGELIKRLDRVDDSEAVAVLTTSAGLCAIGIG
jgi:predicted oxidoreductase (fatty acid repression mutant protein)